VARLALLSADLAQPMDIAHTHLFRYLSEIFMAIRTRDRSHIPDDQGRRFRRSSRADTFVDGLSGPIEH